MANNKIVNVETLDAYGSKIKTYVDHKDSLLQTNISTLASEVALKANTSQLGTLAGKNTVEKSDLESSVQTTLDKVGTIEGKIPSEASATNQLADKSWVNNNAGKIDKVQKNGVDLTITNKTVNITVPTQASDIGAEAAFTKNTAFNKNFATSAPAANGTANAGSTNTVSRGDHVHPTDTSRAAAVHTHSSSDINGLDTALDNLTAVAEGKTATYVANTSNSVNTTLNVNTSSIACPDSIALVDGTTLEKTALKTGDIILLTPTTIPDRWYNSTDGKLYTLETTKVDLTDYARKKVIEYTGYMDVYYVDEVGVITNEVVPNLKVPVLDYNNFSSIDYNIWSRFYELIILQDKGNSTRRYNMVLQSAEDNIFSETGGWCASIVTSTGAVVQYVRENNTVKAILKCFGTLPSTNNSQTLPLPITGKAVAEAIKDLDERFKGQYYITVYLPENREYIDGYEIIPTELLMESLSNWVDNGHIGEYSATLIGYSEILIGYQMVEIAETIASYRVSFDLTKNRMVLVNVRYPDVRICYNYNSGMTEIQNVTIEKPLERATIADLTDIWTTT